MRTDWAIVLTFGLYFIVVILLGICAWRRTKTGEDYFLGGRSTGPWVTALSAGASDMSGWLLLGLPGYMFASGAQALWLAAGLLLGTWLNWLIVARRLRVFSYAADNALTLPEFFVNRFHGAKLSLRLVPAFFIVIFYLFYTSAGLVAGGKLFETALGLDYTTAVVVGSVAVISYTLFGGYLAVCWTDLIQGLMMAAALVAVPVVIMGQSGGGAAVVDSVTTHNPLFLDPLRTMNGEPLGWITIVSLLGWGLGYFGQPHILSRFKGIRSERDIAGACTIACSWSAICLVAALLVGVTGLAFSLNNGLVIDDPEEIFIILVNAAFHPVVAGILLAAILAAVMSTADSQLLVCSTVIAEDFYKGLCAPHASPAKLLWVGRITVVVLAVIAALLALDPDSSVLDLVAYAWAGFGAAFGPVLLLSLFWKEMTGRAALAGIVAGGATVVIWQPLSGGLFDLYELVPAFVISAAVVVVVTALDRTGRRPSKDRFLHCQRQLNPGLQAADTTAPIM